MKITIARAACIKNQGGRSQPLMGGLTTLHLRWAQSNKRFKSFRPSFSKTRIKESTLTTSLLHAQHSPTLPRAWGTPTPPLELK